jgi:hypothetical protein
MQRLEAKNPPERPLLSAETGNVENRGKIPAETASFRSTTVSAVREDWMVVCTVRYEPVSDPNSLITAVLQGIFAKNCLFCGSRPDFGSDDQRLSGKFPKFVNREFY